MTLKRMPKGFQLSYVGSADHVNYTLYLSKSAPELIHEYKLTVTMTWSLAFLYIGSPIAGDTRPALSGLEKRGLLGKQGYWWKLSGVWQEYYLSELGFEVASRMFTPSAPPVTYGKTNIILKVVYGDIEAING